LPPFPKPTFAYDYSVTAQIAALSQWRDTRPGRAIPAKSPNHLLVATWNIANLGVQERRRRDYQLLAEIISWFDPMTRVCINSQSFLRLSWLETTIRASHRAGGYSSSTLVRVRARLCGWMYGSPGIRV
jgi:hypothetical protein